MRKVIRLSEAISKNPKFKDKVEWKKKSEDIILENEKFGSIIHSVVCNENGDPIYDVPIFDERENCIVIPFTKKDAKIDKVFIVFNEFAPGHRLVLQFPGGFIDDEESPEIAALRELKEECGISTTNHPLLLGKLIANKSFSKKPETYVYTLDITHHVLSDKEFDGRETESFSEGYYSISEIDELIKKGDIHLGFVLSAWLLFKEKFKDLI